jgi:N-acetylglucosamine kinase-like BadF-type ATPase
MAWKIGVDGGGSKTECILVDPSGAVAARHTGPGCNPTLVGAARAGELARDAIRAVRDGKEGAGVSSTLLCMAGSRVFWREFGDGLQGCGRVTTADDSLPALELATRGAPGLVLHSGTGSFVAARSPDGAVRYAGGLGWRFGDEGGGYDIGRRAVARALLEIQGWAPPSGLGVVVGALAGGLTPSEFAGRFHAGPEDVSRIAAIAPSVLRLAADGDPVAGEAVSQSVLGLLALAVSVAAGLFPGEPPGGFRAGVSGSILNHPFAYGVLASRAPFPLSQVTEPPIEGVRLLLARGAG